MAAKIAKSSANYTYHTKGDHKCHNCTHYEPGPSGLGSCAKVKGVISPLGWCRYWQVKGEK